MICQFLVVENEAEFVVDTDAGTCCCHFYQAMWLPCIHLLSFFRSSMYSYGELFFVFANIVQLSFPFVIGGWRITTCQQGNLRVPVEVPQANRTLTRLYKLITKALGKTYQFNIATAKKVFNPQDGGVIGSLVDAGDNCKQPRWRTSTNQPPCGLCSSEVSEQGVNCGADRISFHRQCLHSLELTTCPSCSGHLDILTANIVEQHDVPSCSKSVPSRKRRNISQSLVDLDASEST